MAGVDEQPGEEETEESWGDVEGAHDIELPDFVREQRRKEARKKMLAEQRALRENLYVETGNSMCDLDL